MAACLLTIVALPIVRHSKVDFRRASGIEADAGAEDEQSSSGSAGLWKGQFFMLLALCFFFNFSNMAQLQLLVQQAAQQIPDQAINFTSAAQVVAHLGMLVASVMAGRFADFGRKPLILTACITVTVRALLTAATDVWWVQAQGGSIWLSLLPCETLDGICAGLWLMLMVLMAKDVSENTGCFSLALGCLQAAFSVGAIFSSEIAGVLANALGFAAAFLALAAIGLISLALAACTPETQVGYETSGGHSLLVRLTRSCRSWLA